MNDTYQIGWRDAYHRGKNCNPFNPKTQPIHFEAYEKGFRAGCDAFERW